MSTVSACYRCAVLCPVTDFYRDKSKASGRQSICKACCKEKARLNYYERNPGGKQKPKRSIRCSVCESSFRSNRDDAKYCGKACLDKAMVVRSFVERHCVRCDVALAGSTAKRWCSDCRIEVRRERDRERMRIMGSGDRRRARHFGVAYEAVSRETVYTRDGWVCGLCRKGVDGSLRWPHDMSASLDHVVPISLGGPHLYSNVQLAHLGCNVAKRDSLEVGPESLAEALS